MDLLSILIHHLLESLHNLVSFTEGSHTGVFLVIEDVQHIVIVAFNSGFKLDESPKHILSIAEDAPSPSKADGLVHVMAGHSNDCVDDVQLAVVIAVSSLAKVPARRIADAG